MPQAIDALVKPPQIETRSIDFVPENERHGKIGHQGPFWFLSNFHFMSIAMGFIGPSMGLSLGATVLASVIGILVGTTFQAFHASQGPQLGLPQMLQSRAQFGYRGVIVPLLAGLFSPLSFNIVAAVLIAQGAHELWGVNRVAVTIAVALVSGILAIVGHDWLHKVFRLLFWISLPLYAILSFAVMGHHAGITPPAAGGWVWTAFFTQLSATASFNIGLAPYVSDYSRYLPKQTSRAQIIAQVFLGSAVSAIWLIALGAWLATQFGATDGLLALHQAGDSVMHGFGLLAVTISICALVAVVAMNSYSGMLMAITAADCLGRVRPTKFLRVAVLVGWTAVWAVFAASLNGNAINYIGSAMVILLYALIPWTAVNLVDFFILRRGQYAIADLLKPNGVYGLWNMRGLMSYALGFIASIPFFVVPGLFTGPLAAHIGGVDIGWVVGLVAAGGAYYLSGQKLTSAAQLHAVVE